MNATRDCLRCLSLGVFLTCLSALAHAKTTPIKVFLLGGQSNMLGRAQVSGLPIELQGTQKDVLFIGGSNGTAGTTLEFLRPDGKESDEFGPEVTFGRTIANLNPGTDIALIKYAASGTNLSSSWNPTTGVEYAKFLETVTNGLSELTNANYAPEIIGMLWHQGESDVGQTQANYQTMLTGFIGDVRSRYGANLPFMIGEIRNTGPDAQQIINAQSAVAAADPYASFVAGSDLTFGDSVHFDAAGMTTLGERFANNYQANYGYLVPEPSTLMLFGLGGICLIKRRRRLQN